MPTVEITDQTLKQFVEAAGSAWGAQLYIVMFFGVAAGLAIIGVVWWLMGMKLKPIDKLEQRVEKMQETLTEINQRIWSEDNLNNKIENMINRAMAEHVREHHSKQ